MPASEGHRQQRPPRRGPRSVRCTSSRSPGSRFANVDRQAPLPSRLGPVRHAQCVAACRRIVPQYRASASPQQRRQGAVSRLRRRVQPSLVDQVGVRLAVETNPGVSAQQRPDRLVQHQVIAAKGDRLVCQAPPLLLARALGQPLTGQGKTCDVEIGSHQNGEGLGTGQIAVEVRLEAGGNQWAGGAQLCHRSVPAQQHPLEAELVGLRGEGRLYPIPRAMAGGNLVRVRRRRVPGGAVKEQRVCRAAVERLVVEGRYAQGVSASSRGESIPGANNGSRRRLAVA